MNNKSFCAEEISGLIQELDHNFFEYEDKADIFISHCNEFKDNDSYQGTNAVAAKIIVGEKEVEIANLQKGLHTKLLDMYKHAAQSFADKVDSAPNARLDLDALTISENGLKSLYGKMDDYCCKFENIAKEMQNKYGHIGTITVPDCNPLRESMINLCGGDVDNAGFLYELKRKLIDFDEEECAYIDSLNFEDDIKSVNNGIINVNNTVFNTQNYDPIGLKNMLKKHLIALNNKLLFTSDDGMGAVSDNDGDSTSNYNADDIILGIIQYYYNNNLREDLEKLYNDCIISFSTYKKELIFSFLKNNYRFSDEEILFLKSNYEKQLIALYLIAKVNTTEADKAYQEIDSIWHTEGLGYYEDAEELVNYCDITDKQKEAIFRLKDLEDKLYPYSYFNSKGEEIFVETKLTRERIATMEVAAAYLYEYGASTEFVSAVLGNIAFEGGVGHIENTKYSENEPMYLCGLERYFEDKTIIKPEEAEIVLKSKFDRLYADKTVYSLICPDNFIRELENYRNNSEFDNICGVGMCQWTTKDRLEYLLKLYDGCDYTFKGLAKSEATMMINELKGEFGDDFKNLDKECEDEYKLLNGTDKVEEEAKYFYDNYEKGGTPTGEFRADVASHIYEVLN